MKQYTALIVAAGSGTRMNLGYNKVYAKLSDGRTILEHTMSVFQNDPDCGQIIVVTDSDDYMANIKRIWPGRITLARGGSTRQESVMNGLAAVIFDHVMIHDGARPFLKKECIDSLKEALCQEKAALLMVPCKDTIKEVRDGYVVKTYERSSLMAAQTPQAFETELIRDCMQKAIKSGFTGTDDASLVENFSDARVKAVTGDYGNYKITTPEDLEKK